MTVLTLARTQVGIGLELIRPRMAAMIALMVILGASMAGTGQWARSLEAALYVTLVTGAASILNQVLERETDAKMPRTQHRPLVTGRIEPSTCIFLALLLGTLGTVGLAVQFNLLSATLTLATLFAYVAIYTPLKQVSTFNTVVGAVPGAAPPLLGYVALAGDVGPWAWCLFAVLFVWQFPHFMAIAWLYREDYAKGGHKMLTSVPNAEGLAGRQAVVYAIAAIPISLLPLTTGLAGPVYAVGVSILGAAYLICSVGFARNEDRRSARRLLFVSLLYLPLWACLVLADPLPSLMLS
jgi:heme o synthase